MSDVIQQRMLKAIYACMLPLARLLLRSGITYHQFDSVVKRAFVREAVAEADSRGRPANTSRVAVKTGLSRKDVKRIRDLLACEPVVQTDSVADQSGPPARVLHAWHFDKRFIGPDGRPRDLDFQDDQTGFQALVRAVGGDVPPGAVRAELRRAGAIVDLSDGKVRAAKRYYVPGSVDEKVITVMSGMMFPLASGIAHNSDPHRTTDGFIQRFAFSNSLSVQSVTAFRKWSREQATKFVEEIDDWLAQNEMEHDGEEPFAAEATGIGVFYYEGPTSEAEVSENVKAGSSVRGKAETPVGN